MSNSRDQGIRSLYLGKRIDTTQDVPKVRQQTHIQHISKVIAPELDRIIDQITCCKDRIVYGTKEDQVLLFENGKARNHHRRLFGCSRIFI